MPTVDVDPDELRSLTGTDKDDEQLKEDLFALGLEYEGRTEEGEFELEFAPDRLDRLSVEGIARSLRYHYGDDRGVYVPETNSAEWSIHVEDVPPERPYVTGTIARGVNLDEDALDSLIQLQEKLHATMGRQRRKGAIGIHDLTMLKGEVLERADEQPGDTETTAAGGKAVTYTGIPADGERFVPLDSDREMTPGEVLEEHPTGTDYADLVAEYASMPAIYDELGLFSFPPVINGRRTEVSADSRDLFIEMTGTDQWTIDKMLNVVCYALDARGARIEDVHVVYPNRDLYAGGDRVQPGATLVRPDLSTKTKTVSHDRVESVLGVSFAPEEVLDLMERAGLDAEIVETDDGTVYEATIPPYRVDVLHPLDVIDDVGRAYGFNELEPRYPDVSTVGGRHERSRLEEAVRETLVGMGFEDLLNFHMISEADNFDRMGIVPGEEYLGGGRPARIKTPYSEEFEIVRTWALPSVVMLLGKNTHRAYPQDVAEVGFAAHVDDEENTGLAEHQVVAAALARTDVSYEDARSRLQALTRAFDTKLETPATDHPTFIDGRVAEVVIDGDSAGIIGEIHPEVLVEHDMEVPVAAFEFDLDALR